MLKNSVTSTRKSFAGLVGSQTASTKLWAAIAACLVLAATMLPAGAGVGTSPKESQSYSCSSVCYDRFYNCIVAGKGVTYCQSQLSLCLAACGGTARVGQSGGGEATDGAEQAPTEAQ